MLKIANKKVIRTIAFRTMWANRKKNIAVIIAVILTTILFTTLFSVGMSMIETSQKSTMRQVGGSSMAGIKYAKSEDYEKLRTDTKLEDISYRIVVGVLSDSSLDTLVTEVYYSTDENAKACFSYPTTGKMPEEENEIVLSTLTMEKLGIRQELGQTISLKLKIGEKEIKKGFVLCGYYDGDIVAMSQMAYVSKKYQEKVAPEPEVSYNDSLQSDMTGYWMIDFDFHHSLNIEKQTKELLRRNGYDIKAVDYGVNWAYAASDVDEMSVALCIAILLLILLAGYLIIYNIFYITVASYIHEYGLLKTIGTTGKQLKKIVWMQAAILAAIGISIGLLLGTMVSRSVFPVILSNTSLDAGDMVISIHPLIYIFATLFSLITVAVGCRKPRKIASRVSPIEAVSYNPVSHVKRKKRKTKKISIVKLALANIGREKNKAVIVILSLTLSVLLVNEIYSVVIGLDADKYISQNIIGDFIVSDVALNNVNLFVDDTTVVAQEDINYLESLDGIKTNSNVYCDMYASIDMSDAMKNRIEALMKHNQQKNLKAEVDMYLSEKRINCEYYGIDEFPMDHLTIHDGEIDRKLWNTGEYAIFYCYQLIDGEDEDMTDITKVGDEVSVTLQNGEKKSYKIMAIAEMPYAMTTKAYSTVGSQLIVPEQEYLANEDNTGALASIIEADEDALSAVDKQISAYVEQSDSLSYVSKKTYLDQFDNFIKSIELVGGGLAFILALIGIMNFINAEVTGIWRRSRELAMMQAVGLTEKQMAGMLVWEGLFQGLGSIIVAIVLHVVLGSPAIQAFAGEIWFFKYHFTVAPIALCLPFVLLIAIVVPYVVCNNMKKKSVVERIKVS